MNINLMMRRIKRKLKIHQIAFPFDLDKEIHDILEDTTLPVFSIYQPHVMKFPIDLCQHPIINARGDGSDLYILPNFSEEKPLLYVKRVDYDDSYMRSNYMPGYRFGRLSFESFEDLMVANAGKHVVDNVVNSITFHYEHPNKLYVYDALVSAKLIVTGAFQHDASFQSIPETAADSFFQLAVLDVMEGTWDLISPYNGMETALGRIELNVPEWEGAKDKREELIREWDETYLLDAVDYDFN